MALAQTPPSSLLQVVTATVKPSAVPEYEDYLKKLVAARQKIDQQLPARVSVYTIRMGGPLHTYMLVAPFDGWADIDNFTGPTQVLAKASGEAEARKLMQVYRSSVESIAIEVFRALPDLSWNTTSVTPPYRFVVLARTAIDPTMTQEYEIALSKQKAAVEKAGFPALLRSVTVHGTTPSYLSARPFTKWAERGVAPPSILQALEKMYGATEARLIRETIRRATRSRESWVLSFREDLSWARAARTSQR